MEIELPSESAPVKLPPFLQILREVTETRHIPTPLRPRPENKEKVLLKTAFSCLPVKSVLH